MTKNRLIYLLLAIAVILFSASLYQYMDRIDNGESRESAAPVVEYYTCPMHPQIHAEKPGECPICHMTLVPVYREPPAKDLQGDHAGHADQRESEAAVESSFTVEREGQELIGIRTAVVVRSDVRKVLNTTGRVAFDPELSIVIREYLSVYRSDPELRRASENRLRLLGMGDAEIRNLPSNRSAYEGLYLPVKSGTVWVYATVYEHELPLVKAGQSARVSPSYSGGEVFTGTIRSISPTVDPQSRSVTARIEVRGGGGKLLPDSFVNVEIQAGLGKALSIPQSAVLDSGREKSVFVMHGGKHFTRKIIRTGIATDDSVVVLDGLAEGDEVVSSAAFMIDSESKLHSTATSPEGHKH